MQLLINNMKIGEELVLSKNEFDIAEKICKSDGRKWIFGQMYHIHKNGKRDDMSNEDKVLLAEPYQLLMQGETVIINGVEYQGKIMRHIIEAKQCDSFNDDPYARSGTLNKYLHNFREFNVIVLRAIIDEEIILDFV